VQLARGLERLRAKLPREFAAFGLLGATRGLAGVRAVLLRELGLPAGVGPITTGSLVAWTAFAATPLLWPAPFLVCAGTLALARPALFPFLSLEPRSSEPVPVVEPVAKEDPMLSTALVLAALATTPVQDGREEVPVESVAEKVAALEVLVGELLVLAQPGAAEADAAWTALQQAKQRILEEEQRRRREAFAAQNAQRARVQAWVEAVQQIGDEAARARALDELEAALSGTDPALQLAACQALTACGQVQYDKARFRPLVRPLAETAHGALRVSALYALLNTVHEPADRALALALADDPSEEARVSGPHLVASFHDNVLTGEAGGAVLRLFRGSTYAQRRQMLSGLWGARIAPELESYLLELSRSSDPNDQYDAMYYALSTLPEKSEAVVARLIEFTPSTDPNRYQRALWGLSYGVAPAQSPLVAEAARALFDARSDEYVQSKCLGLLGQHAGPELEPWLAAIAADARRPESVRSAAAEALAALQSR
jgi:hypothetical protein